MFFEKDRLVVRSLEKKDNKLLVKWLSNPLILKYYEGRDNPFNLEKVNRKFFNQKGRVTRCIVEYGVEEIGYCQFYPLDNHTRKIYGYENNPDIIYGMDQFIGESTYWNKGIGTLLIQVLVHYLVNQYEADKIVLDPQAWNERAIHCYKKSGFQKVKLLPRHEWHEGEYRNCWLMEYNNKVEGESSNC
ncbi:GNAT family N-acetyltransferase [Virgibacillus sp. LDC-1]|uniref:GNAT family N-acetyltransferase n=1 Tax=Virgibacillus sp. LDC-1 TaxID=3039856 RepID=UPI0024DE54D1|nr:GNAT family N-acetyltransferase [Virgibacillus sp. LDC-1]